MEKNIYKNTEMLERGLLCYHAYANIEISLHINNKMVCIISIVCFGQCALNTLEQCENDMYSRKQLVNRIVVVNGVQVGWIRTGFSLTDEKWIQLYGWKVGLAWIMSGPEE